ncbi:MAG: ABC transporter substrate-binding protein [Acidobacteriota bacterium]
MAGKIIKVKFQIVFSLMIFLLSNINLSYAADSPLIYLKAVAVSTLDPGLTTDTYSSEVISNIYEGLVRYKKNSTGVEPSLAVKWSVDNEGKRWVFKLRKGVKFHNGKVFNAESVVFNFQTRILDKNKYSNWNRLNSHISRIGSIDEYTIEILLNKPFVPFLNSLASPKHMIVEPSSYKRGSFKPTGTGPFKHSESSPGKYLSIIRNENYWGGKVRIPKIVFKIVDDVAWRVIQLKSGKASMLMVHSSKEYEELRGRRDFRLISVPSVSVHYLAFNTQKGIFRNRNVRLAFSHLINKGPLIGRIFQNFGSNATTPVPRGIFGFNPAIKDREFDVGKARNFLKLGGVKEGERVSLYYSGNSKPLGEIAGVIKKFAAKVGVYVYTVPLSFGDLRKAIKSKRHDMVMMGWSGDIPDPDVFLYGTFADPSSEFNRSGYSDTELTKLLNDARKSIDTEKREKMYFRAQEIIARDCPWIPLYSINDIVVINGKIKNLYINQLSYVIFKDAYVEEN